MRAARIENGLVADLWDVPSLDCYGPDVVLVEAPDHVQIGDGYDSNSGFVAIIRTIGAEESRSRRDYLLSICDWTQLADAPLTTTEKSAWKKYRQDLRDVPEQSGFPAEIVWPVAPN